VAAAVEGWVEGGAVTLTRSCRWPRCVAGRPAASGQKICQQMAALHCTGWVRPTNGWVETGTHPAQSRCAGSDITTSQAATDILASYRLNATPTSP